MARHRLNLYSIRSGAAFLDELIGAMMSGRLALDEDMRDPAVLARTTVYLPTRRAAQAFNRAIAARFDGRALLLPRVVPLGDVEEAELSLIGDPNADTSGIPPAIDAFRRRLELTRLVMACGRAVNRDILRLDSSNAALMPATLADAFDLAADLAALLDQLQIEGISYEALRRLDASNHDRLWEITATFLDIVGVAWPAFLAQEGACDPARRRNLIMEAERQRLLVAAAAGPIIAAGSTGTIPATARLLDAIARHRQGAVILPGLDLGLEDGAWAAIADPKSPAPSHPQFALRRLLDLMNATRADVVELVADDRGMDGGAPSVAIARADLLQEALRPAAASGGMPALSKRISAEMLALAYDGLSLVEASDERHEALVVAVALREVLETPGKTAALVTADRGLAERAAIELLRWDVTVDDSAGRSLSRTAAGHLASLIVDTVRSAFEPRAVLALLSHPLTRLGMTRAQIGAAVAALEIGAVRGVVVKPGFPALLEALANGPERASHRHAPRPRKRLNKTDFDLARQVLQRLERTLGALAAALSGPVHDLAAVAHLHRMAFLDILAGETSDAEMAQDSADQARADATHVDALFDSIIGGGGNLAYEGQAADYAAMFDGLSRETTLPPRQDGHPRLKIWGLLEARLLQVDRIVLGGLSEGDWPPLTRTDAFLNRPMREQVGLSSPEQRIGQTAHDFVQAMAAREVIAVRPLKKAGAETIPSRFWQRLKAVSAEPHWAEAIARGDRLIGLADRLSQPDSIAPRPAPEPRPPAHLQPVGLSVTQVETLLRDPYAVYARHVLKLDPLEDIEIGPTAADRGTLLHAIIEEFSTSYPGILPGDAEARLIEIGQRHFARAHDDPQVLAFWWPRFQKMASGFVAWDKERRADLAALHSEVSGAYEFDLPAGGRFRLNSKADRLEITTRGTLRIVDFKTSTTPSASDIRRGFAPQLTLQEALATRGAYQAAGPLTVESVRYLKLMQEKRKLSETPSPRDAPPPGMAEQHLVSLLELVSRYRSGSLAFVSHLDPGKANYVRPYDQLARVKEWTAAFEDGDQGGSS